MRPALRNGLAIGRIWWTLVVLALSIWAIWSLIHKPPIPWWALGLLVLGLIVVAQFIRASALDEENRRLRKRPEEQEREFSERLRRELRDAADTKAERRREERRRQRNELQQMIDAADELLRVAHDTFRKSPIEWSEWVTRHEWWAKEALMWLELNADAPEIAHFKRPLPSPRIFHDSPNAPLDMHTQVLIWSRDGLKEILRDRFPPLD